MAVVQQTDFPNLYHRGKIRDMYDRAPHRQLRRNRGFQNVAIGGLSSRPTVR